MKKFLFTLAALMMAGSAFAANYFYMEPFEVPESALGATGTAARINVDVKAHFDNYVSAWDLSMTLPEGLTVQGVRSGSDLTLSFLDEFGDPKTVTPTINKNLTSNPVKIIVANTEAGFDEDGNQYGAVKWAPGDYNQMWIFVFNAAADFAGGEITISTICSCGQDTRPEVAANMADNQPYSAPDGPIAVTVEGQGGPEALAGTVDVTFNDNVATLSYNVNDPNATAVVTVNGDEVEVEWNRAAHTATWTAPINTTPGTYTYVVKLTVNGDGTNFEGTLSDQDTYSYTIKEKTATPEIIIDETHHNYVKFHVEGDGEVLVYIDGDLATPDANGFYYVYASTTADVTYVVTATAQEEGKDISDPATKTIEIAQWDSVNELVNGKTVAGVRYYNMAGQEMQQANGMTIVVTTYTDGTTSAVKVIK